MAFLEVAGLTKSFEGHPVLLGLDLSIGRGEFWALVGPSGCGKSVFLRIIAGLLAPDSGMITLGGRDVTALPPAERDIAMVFQSYALYPHLTVEGNIGIGLRKAGLSRAATHDLADHAVVMNAGRIEQFGPPMDLHHDPDTMFVAGFIGSPRMNFLPSGPLGRPGHLVGVRPEHITVDQNGCDPAMSGLAGHVEHVETLGSETNLFVRTEHLGIVTVRLFGHQDFAPVEALFLRLDRQRELYFALDGRRIR